MERRDGNLNLFYTPLRKQKKRMSDEGESGKEREGGEKGLKQVSGESYYVRLRRERKLIIILTNCHDFSLPFNFVITNCRIKEYYNYISLMRFLSIYPTPTSTKTLAC